MRAHLVLLACCLAAPAALATPAHADDYTLYAYCSAFMTMDDPQNPPTFGYAGNAYATGPAGSFATSVTLTCEAYGDTMSAQRSLTVPGPAVAVADVVRPGSYGTITVCTTATALFGPGAPVTVTVDRSCVDFRP